jgi:glycosyltransferase involved in cell wall biosynthesis
MDSDTLISFIVPVFNAEKTLARCLESIVNQTTKCFEIILVNDGSRDGSQFIIDKYATDYPNFIKSYTKPNSGPGETRNLGIKKATGHYIAFVDSDDFLEVNYVETISHQIKSHKPDMLIISYNRIYQKNPSIFEKTYKFSSWNYYNFPFFIDAKPEIIGKIEVASWLRIIKKDILLTDGLLFGKFHGTEDLEASLKWYLTVNSILIIKEPLYNYIINNETLNTKTENLKQYNDVIKSVCEYYKNHNKFETFFNELEYVFTKHMILSNLVRLKNNKDKGNLHLFLSLRSTLIQFFPHFHKNKYLNEEPLYVRIAISLAFYFPRFYSLIL